MKQMDEATTTPTMKTCGKCKRTLPVSEFSKDRSRRDGLLYRCKACDRQYRVEHRKERNERQRRYYARHADRLHAYYRQYYAANKEKDRARHAVRAAVKSGKLPHISTMTCAICGAPAQVYHHEDYSKRYDVIPLCMSCHMLHHQLPDTVRLIYLSTPLLPGTWSADGLSFNEVEATLSTTHG
jgi:hypothetical protein